MAVQKDHWYNRALLILLSSLTVSVQQTDGVTTVKLEEGMVLVCVCPWEGNLTMVSWTKLIRFNKVPIAVYHPEYEVFISQSYQTRIQFLKTTPMDGSITITNVTQEDTGVYHCSVQSFPRGSWVRDVSVEEDDADQEETDIHIREPERSPVDFSRSAYLIYIYVGGGVAGLLILLSVILILVVWQRKKKRREEYRIKLHPAQRQNVPVHDRMRKGTNQRGDMPVYANMHSIRPHTKRTR